MGSRPSVSSTASPDSYTLSPNSLHSCLDSSTCARPSHRLGMIEVSSRAVVPPRSAPARQPGAARRRRRRPGHCAVRARRQPCATRPAPPASAFLYRTLRALDDDLRAHGGRLWCVPGHRTRSSRRVAARGRRQRSARQRRLRPVRRRSRRAGRRRRWASTRSCRTGSPYAVAPGRVTQGDGEPFKVFTAFYRAWQAHGWRDPARFGAAKADWRDDVRLRARARTTRRCRLALTAARRRRRRPPARPGRRSSASASAYYADARDRPDLDATSRISAHLHWGTLHPRTLLADLGAGDETFRKELAWREFYAAVLHLRPESARDVLPPAAGRDCPTPPARPPTNTCRPGGPASTGYPIVDAGMRQLLAEGWMHNRVRMIVASFLVKDLHLEWTVGARHFMQHLVDGDLASNNTAGSGWPARGTDAAPYFRVFNPITAGQEVRPGRRLHPALRARAARRAGQARSTSPGRGRTACRAATRSRSSTTPRNASALANYRAERPAVISCSWVASTTHVITKAAASGQRG